MGWGIDFPATHGSIGKGGSNKFKGSWLSLLASYTPLQQLFPYVKQSDIKFLLRAYVTWSTVRWFSWYSTVVQHLLWMQKIPGSIPAISRKVGKKPLSQTLNSYCPSGQTRVISADQWLDLVHGNIYIHVFTSTYKLEKKMAATMWALGVDNQEMIIKKSRNDFSQPQLLDKLQNSSSHGIIKKGFHYPLITSPKFRCTLARAIQYSIKHVLTKMIHKHLSVHRTVPHSQLKGHYEQGFPMLWKEIKP